MSPRIRRIPLVVRTAALLVFMLALTAASLTPGDAQPGDSVFVWLVAQTPTLLQKSLHVGFYGVLAVLWVWTLETVPSKASRLLIASAAALAFGIAMEAAQTLVPGRFGTLFDVGLDGAGIAIGALAAVWFL
jgi:VanZ family protein